MTIARLRCGRCQARPATHCATAKSGHASVRLCELCLKADPGIRKHSRVRRLSDSERAR